MHAPARALLQPARLYGEESADHGLALHGLCITLASDGAFGLRGPCRRAVTILERSLGATHRALSWLLLGGIGQGLGNVDTARDMLEHIAGSTDLARFQSPPQR